MVTIKNSMGVAEITGSVRWDGGSSEEGYSAHLETGRPGKDEKPDRNGGEGCQAKGQWGPSTEVTNSLACAETYPLSSVA